MHLSIKFERPIRSCKHSHSHRLSHSFWGGFWLFASTKIVLARAGLLIGNSWAVKRNGNFSRDFQHADNNREREPNFASMEQKSFAR